MVCKTGGCGNRNDMKLEESMLCNFWGIVDCFGEIKLGGNKAN